MKKEDIKKGQILYAVNKGYRNPAICSYNVSNIKTYDDGWGVVVERPLDCEDGAVIKETAEPCYDEEYDCFMTFSKAYFLTEEAAMNFHNNCLEDHINQLNDCFRLYKTKSGKIKTKKSIWEQI